MGLEFRIQLTACLDSHDYHPAADSLKTCDSPDVKTVHIITSLKIVSVNIIPVAVVNSSRFISAAPVSRGAAPSES